MTAEGQTQDGIVVERTPVEGRCRACGAEDLRGSPRPLRGRVVDRRPLPVLPHVRQSRAVGASRVRLADGLLMAPEMLGVDVGGTFTDVVAIEDGRVSVAKVPTDLHSSDTRC